MELREISTLVDVAKANEIAVTTLQSRLKFLEDGIDYKKLGAGQPTILSPLGVEKILQKPSKKRVN